jgi:DMSO reductase anchor subunit
MTRTSTGFPQTDARPSIRFVPLREGHLYPEMTAASATAPPGTSQNPPVSKVSLRSEWSLLVFTLLTALLVGSRSAPGASARITVWVFLLASGVAAGLSTLHLGRPQLAYRALLNWRRSWLSREIILFAAFVGASVIQLSTAFSTDVMRWIVTVVGFALLFAMDSVYHVTRTPALRLHSAQVILTGVLVLGFITNLTPVSVGVVLLKGMLYIARKVRFTREAAPARPLASILRLSIGIALPAALWQIYPAYQGVIVAAVVLGELIDRAEFYMELTILTPKRQMATDLQAMLTTRAR